MQNFQSWSLQKLQTAAAWSRRSSVIDGPRAETIAVAQSTPKWEVGDGSSGIDGQSGQKLEIQVQSGTGNCARLNILVRWSAGLLRSKRWLVERKVRRQDASAPSNREIPGGQPIGTSSDPGLNSVRPETGIRSAAGLQTAPAPHSSTSSATGPPG